MIGLVTLAVAALLARVGLTMYVAGLARAKNSAGTVLRVVADLGVASLAVYVVGAALVTQSPDRPVWQSFEHLYARTGAWVGVVAAFVLLAPIASGIVVGAVGERSRFGVVLAASGVLGAVVVPLLGAWMTSGWLGRRLHFVDATGAAWLHVAGGAVALVLARAVGPRDNKYHRDGSASVIPGHSVPLAGVGSVLLSAGLIACASGGDSGPLAPLLTVAAGVVASLALSAVWFGKPDVLFVLTGMLGAAVAAAGGATQMAPILAVLTGAVAGVIVPAAAVKIDLLLHIDDPAGSVAIHLVGGAWGTLAAGLFCPGRTFGEWIAGVGVQVLGLAVALVVAGGAGFAVAAALKGRLRSSEADEFDGLDLAEHDVGAYPDFQQNTIRSYHLREA
ncbi:MAG TPA: hypothetical protein VF796_23990 [Humisphaera sp.]